MVFAVIAFFRRIFVEKITYFDKWKSKTTKSTSQSTEMSVHLHMHSLSHTVAVLMNFWNVDEYFWEILFLVSVVCCLGRCRRWTIVASLSCSFFLIFRLCFSFNFQIMNTSSPQSTFRLMTIYWTNSNIHSRWATNGHVVYDRSHSFQWILFLGFF